MNSNTATPTSRCISAILALLGSLGCSAPANQPTSPTEPPSDQAVAAPSALASGPDRTVLPLAEPEPPLYDEVDVRKAEPPPRFEVKAPKDAPNVVLVLVDDLGFAGTSAFGGPVSTPTSRAKVSGTTIFTPRPCAHPPARP